jgi:hypothetical protein
MSMSSWQRTCFVASHLLVVSVIEKQLSGKIGRGLYGIAHKAAADDSPRISGIRCAGGV